MSSQMRNVIVIGGGLAGMTVAKEVLKQGCSVTILEASTRLGGKAGSDLNGDGLWEDHGYHVFPGWYLNTRQLLTELGAATNLIDVDRTHFLLKPQAPKLGNSSAKEWDFVTFYQFSEILDYFKNYLSIGKLLPKLDSFLAVYTVIDLLSERWSRREFLDRVSLNGFLQGRSYATEKIAELQQQTVLQASSIPSYEVCAMTIKLVIDRWARYPKPLYSFLNGSLQETFIQPFHSYILNLAERNGVKLTILTNWTVKRIVGGTAGVTGIERESGETLDIGAADLVVLATPMEITRDIVDADLYKAEVEAANGNQDQVVLGNLWHLETAPMAALTLYFNEKVPGFPKEHVNLYGSPLKTSFIDISQHWGSLRDQGRTVLDVIASNFVPLQGLPHGKMADLIIKDVLDWLQLDRSVIQGYSLHDNVRKQLFLNTVGAWGYRPGTDTKIPNLYIAGDYCKSEADLTTMESAVESGINTARDLLSRLNLPTNIKPLPLEYVPRTHIWMWKIPMWPLAYGIFLLRSGWEMAVAAVTAIKTMGVYLSRRLHR